jgi:hypothetical protein
MSGYRWIGSAFLFIAVGMNSGCQSAGRPRTVVTPAPSVSGTVDDDGSRVGTTPVRDVTWVDRHPLFFKPREYWDTSGDNKVVKAAAATLVGVPVGIYGEVKQIIVGTPTEPKY